MESYCGILVIVHFLRFLHIAVAETQMCRDSWVRDVPLEDFRQLSCSKCYVQVFFDRKSLTLIWPLTPPYLLHHRLQPNVTYFADALEEQSKVCETTLSPQECSNWQECCREAMRCCIDMQEVTRSNRTKPSCPHTWDGVGCWPGTAAGETISRHCPKYYTSQSVSWRKAKGQRHCTSNGTWEVHQVHATEITDYSSCFDTTDITDVLKVSLLIDVIGHSVSILALILALIIITSSRSLRRDFLSRDSLQLHINLFIAMIGLGVFTLSFDYIFYDGIVHPNDAIYMANPIWCRMLYTSTTYFRTTAYMAMFSEGLFLYRKIARVMHMNAREPTARYFVLTWVSPVVTTTAYVITRIVVKMDTRCWIAEGFSVLELIYMIPNVLSLVCNVVFLMGIQYNLWTRMKGGGDSNDRRTKVLRHALKGTISLLPVFGFQFLFIVYRPAHWPPYEIMAALLTSTQGFLVSIVYCYSTTEVRQVICPNCTTICCTGRSVTFPRCFSRKSANSKDTNLCDASNQKGNSQSKRNNKDQAKCQLEVQVCSSRNGATVGISTQAVKIDEDRADLIQQVASPDRISNQDEPALENNNQEEKDHTPEEDKALLTDNCS